MNKILYIFIFYNRMYLYIVSAYFVIVRLDRTIQNIFKILDSPIKSGNDIYVNMRLMHRQYI
jgi:hypothetical protein